MEDPDSRTSEWERRRSEEQYEIFKETILLASNATILGSSDQTWRCTLGAGSSQLEASPTWHRLKWPASCLSLLSAPPIFLVRSSASEPVILPAGVSHPQNMARITSGFSGGEGLLGRSASALGFPDVALRKVVFLKLS